MEIPRGGDIAGWLFYCGTSVKHEHLKGKIKASLLEDRFILPEVARDTLKPVWLALVNN